MCECIGNLQLNPVFHFVFKYCFTCMCPRLSHQLATSQVKKFFKLVAAECCILFGFTSSPQRTECDIWIISILKPVPDLSKSAKWVKFALVAAAAAAASFQSCPTLCDPIDGSPPGSFIHGIFQARVLEWGAIAFSECEVTWQILVQPGFKPGCLSLQSTWL